MPAPASSLGTVLRHLLELLDGGVEAVYRSGGLDYRPRFTPVMRVLAEDGPSSIRDIALRAGVTHSAVSQTVSDMVRRKLVTTRTGTDARERIVHLTSRGEELLPVLQAYWKATNAAAAELCTELGVDLPAVLQRAVHAVEAHPFEDRILEHHQSQGRRSTRRSAERGRAQRAG